MKIKRFVAKNMREAIRQVREEQGPDAVILSNRRTAGGIEVVAAVDYDAALVQQSLRRAELAAGDASAESDTLPPTAETPAQALTASAGSEADAALAILFDDFGDAPGKPERRPTRSGPAPAPNKTPVTAAAPARPTEPRPQSRATPLPQAPATPTLDASPSAASVPSASIDAAGGPTAAALATVPVSEFQILKAELGSLRQTLETQLAGLAWNQLRQNQPRRYAVLRALSDLGILPTVARGIADQLPENTSPERARFLPLGFLASRIPVATHDSILEGGIVALVGPTGVGKTTTIAKLAARYAATHGTRDIALVAMDHYRIGAQEQLYTYGRLLGVTVHTVSQQLPLAATLERLADRKLVLIDTIGMSPRDPALDGQIAALVGAHPELKAYLMLAATSQAEDQLEVARRFGTAGLAGCIVSKVDETARIGGALSVAIQQRLPIHYLTDGQRVPEDIQLARADHLVIRAMQLARQCASPPDDETLALMHEAAMLSAAAASGGQAHV